MGATATDRVNASEITVGSVIRVERNAAGQLVSTRRKRGSLTVRVTGKDLVTVPGEARRRYVISTTAGDIEPCPGIQTFPIGDVADLVDTEAPAPAGELLNPMRVTITHSATAGTILRGIGAGDGAVCGLGMPGEAPVPGLWHWSADAGAWILPGSIGQPLNAARVDSARRILEGRNYTVTMPDSATVEAPARCTHVPGEVGCPPSVLTCNGIPYPVSEVTNHPSAQRIQTLPIAGETGVMTIGRAFVREFGARHTVDRVALVGSSDPYGRRDVRDFTVWQLIADGFLLSVVKYEGQTGPLVPAASYVAVFVRGRLVDSAGKISAAQNPHDLAWKVAREFRCWLMDQVTAVPDAEADARTATITHTVEEGTIITGVDGAAGESAGIGRADSFHMTPGLWHYVAGAGSWILPRSVGRRPAVDTIRAAQDKLEAAGYDVTVAVTGHDNVPVSTPENPVPGGGDSLTLPDGHPDSIVYPNDSDSAAEAPAPAVDPLTPHAFQPKAPGSAHCVAPCHYADSMPIHNVQAAEAPAPSLTTVPERGGVDPGPVVVAVVSHFDITDRITALPDDGTEDDGGWVTELPDGGFTPVSVPAGWVPTDGDQVDTVAPAPAGTLAPVAQLPTAGDVDQVDPATVRDILSRCTWSTESVQHSKKSPKVLADVLRMPAGERFPYPVFRAVADQVGQLGGGKWIRGVGWPFEPSRMRWDPSAVGGGSATKSGREVLAAWLAGTGEQAPAEAPAPAAEGADQGAPVTSGSVAVEAPAVPVPTIDGVPAGLPYVVDMPKDWPGPVRKLQPTEVGAMLRGARGFLAAWFPGVKFSVRSTWSDGITVRWEDGPADNVVRLVMDMWRSRGFDGMTDSTTYRGPVLHVDAAGNAEALDLPGVFVSTSRSTTDRAALAPFALLKDYPETLGHSEFRDPFGRPFYGGSRQDCARWMASMGVDEWARTGSRDGAPCEVDRCALKSGHPWAPVHVNDYGRAFFGMPAGGDGGNGGGEPLPTEPQPTPAPAADETAGESFGSWADLAAWIGGARPAPVDQVDTVPAPVAAPAGDQLPAGQRIVTVTNDARGNLRVHRTNCRDIGRDSAGGGTHWDVRTYDVRGIVLDLYPDETNGDNWQDFAGDITVMPCAGELPDVVGTVDTAAAVDQVDTVPARPAGPVPAPWPGDMVTVAGWNVRGWVAAVTGARVTVDTGGELSRVALDRITGVEMMEGGEVARWARMALEETPAGDVVANLRGMAGWSLWTSGRPRAGLLYRVGPFNDTAGQRRESAELIAERVTDLRCGCWRIECVRPGRVDWQHGDSRSRVSFHTGCGRHERNAAVPTATPEEIAAAEEIGRKDYRNGIPGDAPGEAPEVTEIVKRYPGNVNGAARSAVRAAYRRGFAEAAARGAAEAVDLVAHAADAVRRAEEIAKQNPAAEECAEIQRNGAASLALTLASRTATAEQAAALAAAPPSAVDPATGIIDPARLDVTVQPWVTAHVPAEAPAGGDQVDTPAEVEASGSVAVDQVAAMLWMAGNDGTGARMWFLVRDVSVPVEDRYHNGAGGELVRFGSYATAQQAADKLNAATLGAKLRKRPAVGDRVHRVDLGVCEVVAVHGRSGEDIGVISPAGERLSMSRHPAAHWLVLPVPATEGGDQVDGEQADTEQGSIYRLPTDAYVPQLDSDDDADLTIRHTHEDGTTLEGGAKGDGTLDIVKRFGFQWRRYAGVHIPHSRDRFADLDVMAKAAAALREAGHTVAVEVDDVWRPAAAREEARAERAEDRAARLGDRADRQFAEADARRLAARRIADGMPFGEPVKKGHHSERAHLAAFDRIERNDRASYAARDYAQHLANRADAAERNEAAKQGPRAIMRRVDRLKADRRDWLRRLADTDKGTTGYARRCRLHIEFLSEDIAYQLAKLGDMAAAGTFVAWSAETVKRDDLVNVHGRWCKVVRINRKGVSVTSRFEWHDGDTVTPVEWHEIYGRRRDGMQWDTPNGEPWPVADAVRVERWAHLVSRYETCTSYDRTDEELINRINVAQARRVVLGLPAKATAQEVAAYGEPADVAGKRARALASLTAYRRLAAGDTFDQVAADTVPLGDTVPAWTMPAGEPVETLPRDLVPGDVVAGVIDGFATMRTVGTSIVGPVESAPRKEDRRESGDWYHVKINGEMCEIRSHRWLMVHRTGNR